MPLATQTEKGLVDRGTLFKCNKEQNVETPYLRIRTGGANFILEVPRPGQNEFLIVNTQLISSSTNVRSCSILNVGGAPNIDGARFMKKTDRNYWLEIHFTSTNYMKYVSFFSLSSVLYNEISFSADPIPDEEIENSVDATIKHFNDL